MLDREKLTKRPRFDFTNQSLECQLRFAAKYSCLDKIRSLVGHQNADINSQNYNDHTPLVISILEDQPRECIELLCKLGANVNHTTDKLYGYSPLHFAAERNRADVIDVLVEYGATRNPQTFTGCTPLHLAAMNGHVEAVGLLCLNGADVNIPEWYNRYTPLHYAIIRRHKRVVDLLLEFNASVTSSTFSGQTALDLCNKEFKRYLCCITAEWKTLERICIHVIRRHFCWPSPYKNIMCLPLPKNVKKKLLLEECLKEI